MKRRRSYSGGVSFFAFQDIVTGVVGIFILITIIMVLELVDRVESAPASTSVNMAELQAMLAEYTVESIRLQDEYDRRVETQGQSASLNKFNFSQEMERLKSGLEIAKTEKAELEDRIDALDSSLEAINSEKLEVLGELADLEESRERIEQLKELAKKMAQTSAIVEQTTSPIYRDDMPNGRSLCVVVVGDSVLTIKDSATQSVKRITVPRIPGRFSTWLAGVGVRQRHFFVLVKPGGAQNFADIQSALQESRASFGFDVVGQDAEFTLAFELGVK
ncbi:hypothetical protein [Crateriforma conspicua]|uniref:Uncharacterized protein n=1 Tax=Crateriforma conspicua TaxID=2527996 RepID=A0A5C6FWA3_9PLAN|nr:hypothetical protein [Crateriforma conspicua]TWU65935.1 hypothetical protein V7x_14890 [Crateriforma conspicua]